jgi:WD40 repeat protein
VHRRLGDAARAWDADGRDPSELYRGTQLDGATEWAAGHADAPNRIEQQFLDTSLALRDAERRRETRRVRRLGALLVAAALALVVSLVAGAIAVGQRNRATDQRRLAAARELAAAANANLDVDPERSILLALEAVERSRTDGGNGGSALPEAEEALHSAVTASVIDLRVPGIGGAVDWSPEGDTFVTEGPEQSGEIDIRDAVTGESVRRFPGHVPDVNAVVYSPDGERLLTTGDDGAARLWDPDTGEQVHALEGQDGPVWGPSISADGRLFAATWPDEGVTRVAELATGRVVREIRAVPRPWKTAFSPDGALIAVASADWTFTSVKVVDVDTGAEILDLRHRGQVQDVAWSPDGASIATSADGAAQIWDASTGQRRIALLGHQAQVLSIDWSPDRSVLATGSADGTARVWLLQEGGARQILVLTAQDMRSGVQGVAFSPDGKRLLTGNSRVTATRIWDVTGSGTAEVANLPSVALTWTGAGFLGDGREVVASSGGASITVWDVEQRRRVRTLGGDPPANVGDPNVLVTPVVGRAEVRLVAVDPAGQHVAAVTLVPGSFADDIVAWNPATGRELFNLRIVDGVEAIAWSQGGEWLAVTDQTPPGDRGHITVYDGTGRVAGEVWEAMDVGIGHIRFSPDGRRIVGVRFPADGSDPPGVHTWDWRTGELLDSIKTPEETRRVWLSDDGSLAASVLASEQIAILDVANGQQVALLTGQTGNTEDIAFSRDNTTLAVGGDDGSVRLWDTRQGREIVTLRGHIGAVNALSFRRDGSQLASASADGTVRIWALHLDDLEAIARDHLTRGLTTDECQRYLHVDRCPAP